MSNEHNPIAIRIGKIQKIWKENVLPYDLKYINMYAFHNDMPLVEGFLKLEASQYGTIHAVFHVMLTSFKDINSFSFYLIQHWIEEFEKLNLSNPSLIWINLDHLKSMFLLLNEESDELHHLLIEIIKDYKQCFVPDIPFYLGIKPMEVSDREGLTKWFAHILPLLPKDVAILTIDVHEKKQYESLLEIAKEKGKNLIIPSLDMPSAYNDLMTQGNPKDPQVEYRKCMLEMGKATGEKNIEKLHHWGDKILKISQSTGNRIFWASAHLVYAGFLLNFSEFVHIDKLLDKGIKIISSVEKNESTMLLLQFYTMKGTAYSIQNDTEKAIGAFIKQIDLAKEKNIPFAQLQGYLYLFMIGTTSNMQNYKLHVKNAYLCGLDLDDEMLKSLNFGFIADMYLEHWASENQTLFYEMSERMERIYGEEWKNIIKQTRLTMKNNKNVVS